VGGLFSLETISFKTSFKMKSRTGKSYYLILTITMRLWWSRHGITKKGQESEESFSHTSINGKEYSPKIGPYKYAK
jgi:hypothetical protein